MNTKSSILTAILGNPLASRNPRKVCAFHSQERILIGEYIILLLLLHNFQLSYRLSPELLPKPRLKEHSNYIYSIYLCPCLPFFFCITFLVSFQIFS